MEFKSIEALSYDLDPETGIFSGYPSVFGILDDGNPWSGVRDIVQPGAFAKTLKENFSRILVCYGHNPYALPIGKPIELKEHTRDQLPEAIIERWPKATGGLFARTKISDTALGRDIKTLLADRVLTELSIGFDPVKADFTDDGKIRHLREVRLWEYSVVPWGMNEAALVLDVKGAIRYRKRPLAEEDTDWDGPAQVRASETEADLMAIHAWYDPEDRDADGNLNKSAFKLPHHMGKSPYKTVWRGVAAAMSRLMQGRTQIPDGDRRAVYAHLKSHYEEFGKEAPDFKDYSGYTDLEIEALCGLTHAFDELAQVDRAIAALHQRRLALTPRKSADAYIRTLEVLGVELDLLS